MGWSFHRLPPRTRGFQNPLFLRRGCRGLNKQGHQQFAARLPRGSAVFSLYLDAVNARLVTARLRCADPLVRRAVDAFAKTAFPDGWLQRGQISVVDALFQSRFALRLQSLVSLPRILFFAGNDPTRRRLRLDHARVPSPRQSGTGLASPSWRRPPLQLQMSIPPDCEALFIQVARQTDTELRRSLPQLAARWGTNRGFARASSGGAMRFRRPRGTCSTISAGAIRGLHETLEDLAHGRDRSRSPSQRPSLTGGCARTRWRVETMVEHLPL